MAGANGWVTMKRMILAELICVSSIAQEQKQTISTEIQRIPDKYVNSIRMPMILGR